MQYDGIVEIVETGLKSGNFYLDKGYKLIGYFYYTRFVESPTNAKQAVMRRGVRYILGRPSDVAHIAREGTPAE